MTPPWVAGSMIRSRHSSYERAGDKTEEWTGNQSKGEGGGGDSNLQAIRSNISQNRCL